MCTPASTRIRDRPIDQTTSSSYIERRFGNHLCEEAVCFYTVVGLTCRLILFRVVIIISFIRRGSDREIYVTRTYTEYHHYYY